jgi:hypothetical protein
MLDMYPSPDDAALIAAFILGALRHIGLAPLPYLAAACVARFWHRHMWAIYLGFAVAAILGMR